MSKFVHMELNTSDPDGAKTFYEGVFGWKYERIPMPEGGDYWIVHGSEGPLGGIQQKPMPDAPNHWLGYAGTDDIAATIKKVGDNGGQVIVPATEVGGMGKLAIFSDPSGAVFAAWEDTTSRAQESGGDSQAKKTAKKAAKKKTAKKAAKKTTAKKAAKKAAPKKAAKKKAAKKKAAKKAAPKKAAKKSAPKKAAKKTAKKAAKKTAQKKAGKKKAGKKKAAKKKTAKKA